MVLANLGNILMLQGNAKDAHRHFVQGTEYVDEYLDSLGSTAGSTSGAIGGAIGGGATDGGDGIDDRVTAVVTETKRAMRQKVAESIVAQILDLEGTIGIADTSI